MLCTAGCRLVVTVAAPVCGQSTCPTWDAPNTPCPKLLGVASARHCCRMPLTGTNPVETAAPASLQSAARSPSVWAEAARQAADRRGRGRVGLVHKDARPWAVRARQHVVQAVPLAAPQPRHAAAAAGRERAPRSALVVAEGAAVVPGVEGQRCHAAHEAEAQLVTLVAEVRARAAAALVRVARVGSVPRAAQAVHTLVRFATPCAGAQGAVCGTHV
mmetsp:Transcript_105941/g.299505  ORF Transcript_105941/g.299505 Transcript_105941/m.299505 type:complete len:217 (+) Transcript_105941:168-818(+)